MATRAWPKGHETPTFDQLVNPIADLIRRAFAMTPVDAPQGFPYHGFETPPCMQVCDAEPAANRFRGPYLAFRRSRGSDVLDIALHLLFNYGFEQGKRLEKENSALLDRRLKDAELDLADTRARLEEATTHLKNLRELVRERGIE